MIYKKLVSLVILLLVFNISFTQLAKYEATYEYINSDAVIRAYSGTSSLYFNDSVSICRFDMYLEDKKSYMTKNNVYVLNISDNEGMPIYTNINSRKQVIKRRFLRNKMIVTDTIIDMNWQLQDDREVVNGYLCLTAKGSHAGRNYTAWYTTEIPYPFGPYKFHGLPGLIVKIQSEDKDVTMNLLSIKPIRDKNYQIKKPTDGVKLNWNEYEKMYFNILEEYNSSSETDMKHGRKDPIEKGKYDLLLRYNQNKRN